MATQCVCYVYPITIPSACMHSCTPSLSPPHFPPPASYLLTRKDVFFTKSEFCQVISAMLHGKDAQIKVDLPPPALWKVGQGAYGGMEGCGGVSVGVASDYAYCVHHAGGMRVHGCQLLTPHLAVSCVPVCVCSSGEYCCLLYSMCVLLTGVNGPVLLVCAPLCTHGVDLTAALLWQALS